MKVIGFIVFFSLFLGKVSSQTNDTVFTSNQVLRIYEVLDSLENENKFLQKQNELNTKLLEQYQISNRELEDLLKYNEKYMAIRNAELQTVEQSVLSLQNYIKVTKRPFWDKPLVWVLVGASTIYASSLIVSNIR